MKSVDYLGGRARSTRSADFSEVPSVITSAINNWLVCRGTGHSSVVDWPCASRVLQSQWVGHGDA